MNPSEIFASSPVVGCLYRVCSSKEKPPPTYVHFRCSLFLLQAEGKPVCYLGNGKYLMAAGEMVMHNLNVFEPGVIEKSGCEIPDMMIWLEEVKTEEE